MTFPNTLMDFSNALGALKAGQRLTRACWNVYGKWMWVELQEPGDRDLNSLPYLYICYPPSMEHPLGARVPWVASHADLLAGDWASLDATAVESAQAERECQHRTTVAIDLDKHGGAHIRCVDCGALGSIDLASKHHKLKWAKARPQSQSVTEARDHFAGLALTTKTFQVRPYDDTAEVARDCYRMADAMLKARLA